MKNAAAILLMMMLMTSLETIAQLPDLQGHRGCRGLYPENTIAAMLHAVDIGVSTLEMDLAITADGEVIVTHDPHVNASITTGPAGEIYTQTEADTLAFYQMLYTRVRQYDVGLRGNERFAGQQKMPACIPTLSELFSAVKKHCRKQRKPVPQFNLEVKSKPEWDHLYTPTTDSFCKLVLEVIEAHKMGGKVIVQSFDMRPLRWFHTYRPHYPLALLVEGNNKLPPSKLMSELGFLPKIYSPHFSLVTHELIAEMHGLGIKVIPWTVNELAQMQRLLHMGADGIISDYPNLFSQLTLQKKETSL